MSEMVERVADALTEQFKSSVAQSAGEPFERTKVSLPHRDIWLGYAKVAIEAMREPTDPMVGAADVEVHGDFLPPDLTWEAMINEALK